MSVLVLDLGSSSVRAAIVGDDGTLATEERVPVLPSSPSPGLVEVDARATADAARICADAVLQRSTVTPTAIGIANQRATTVVWSAQSGEVVGPAIGWQDVRTVGRCLELRAEGLRVAPNLSATKAEWLLQRAGEDGYSRGDLRVGTLDAWLTWTLTAGDRHITDASNALVTGLTMADGSDWDDDLLGALGIPRECLPAIVDSAGELTGPTEISGLPVAAMVGDQQGSLIGQGCVHRGDCKITFGTGAMLDVVTGPTPLEAAGSATFPLIAWRLDGTVTWGREAVMLAAGTCVEWLRDGLGLLSTAAESAALAASVPDTGGVSFVPSLSGTGTPVWDHGARGLLVGLTRGTTGAHVVRAVLEGIAHSGADLVEAIEHDTGVRVDLLRVDGGMSENPTFVQALADASGRTVVPAGVTEATALGAGFLAGVATGMWPDLETAGRAVTTGAHVEPGRALDRSRWLEARERAGGWIPELSALDL